MLKQKSRRDLSANQSIAAAVITVTARDQAQATQRDWLKQVCLMNNFQHENKYAN